MGEGIVGGILLAHDEHRIGVGDGRGDVYVIRHEVGLVEIEADDVVLVGEGGEEHLLGVGLDGDLHRTLEVFLQLFQHIVLKTNDRALIDEIVGGMVEEAHGDGVAPLPMVFFLQFGDMQLGNGCTVAVKEHDRGENQGRDEEENET